MSKIRPYVEDIICAQATPEGLGAISVIRVSGKGAADMLAALLNMDVAQLESHRAYYKKISHKGKFLDEVLVTFFADMRSFTGEEGFEVSTHGSPLIVSDFINLFLDLGARLAEPGEFSYRAYLNGKIDLSKAEGIHYSIHAKSNLAKDLSLNLLEGAFKKELLSIKDLIVWATSRVEASIDFSDQDIDLNHDKEVFEKIHRAQKEFKSFLDSYAVGVVQSKGVSIALCGPPNAGKSTVFNSLVGDERSIVSEEKGTTRDYISETISLKTSPVTLIDTAGLRETENKIEAEGIKRSVDLASRSQLILYLVSQDTLSVEAETFLEELKGLGIPILVLETKQDLGAWKSSFAGLPSLGFSVMEQKDLEALKAHLYETLKPYFELNRNLFVERHRILIEKSYEALSQCLNFKEISGAEDVISSLLYSSLDSLDEILYIEDPEAVRDQIFKDFCLGK